MNKKTYKLFIFDFDGTIGDTKECIIASFQQALHDNNLSDVSKGDIVHNMGLSLPTVFRKLTGDKLLDKDYDKLVDDYRRHYRQFLSTKTLIFPEVKDTLKQLKESGKLLTIATSKKTELAELSCTYLDIGIYFDLFIGDDLVTNKKPHPEMLEHTLKKFGIDKSDAVMIGDSTFDIEMGNAIGMDTIAVTWGAHSKELLHTSKPTYIIDSFSSLLDYT